MMKQNIIPYIRNKQDITPTNSDGQAHGLWVFYGYNGNLSHKQRFVNGKFHGINEGYFDNGKICCKLYWSDGDHVYGEWDRTNQIIFNI